MSKKDKNNPNGFLESESKSESELKQMIDKFPTSVDKMIQGFDQKTEPLVDDSEEDEEDAEPKQRFLFRSLSILSYLFRLTVTGVWKVASFGYFLTRKAISWPFHVVSFFLRKKANASEDEEIEQDIEQNIPKPVATGQVLNSAINPAAAKAAAAAPKTAAVASSVDAVDDDDEFDDEKHGFLSKLNWQGLGFKVTSAAAVALLVTGGYFGVKSFLGKPKTAPVETEITQIEPPKAELPKPEPPKPELPKVEQPKVEPPKAELAETEPSKTLAPPPAPVAKKIVPQAKPTSEPAKQPAKKPDEVVAATNLPKAEPKPSVPPTPPVSKETAKADIKPPALPPPPPPKETVKVQPAPSTASTADPFAALANLGTPEKSEKSAAPNPASADPWNTAASNPAKSTTPVASNGGDTLFPKTSPKTPAAAPVAASATPTPKFAAQSEPTTLNNPVPTSSAVASNSPLNSFSLPSEDSVAANAAPVAPLNAIKSAPPSNLAPLEFPKDVTVSQLAPLKKMQEDDLKPINEQALTIPKSTDNVQSLPSLAFSEPAPKTASQVSDGFAKSPTPPKMKSPIPPPDIEPPMPVIIGKKDEIVPAIPNSGTVQALAVTPPPAVPVAAEPSLGIPADSVAFSQPAAPKPVTASIAPPVTAQPIQPMQPKTATFSPPSVNGLTAQNSAPSSAQNLNLANSTANINESAPAIPKDSQVSVSTLAAPAPVVIPAMLPQHEELAKVNPPLGSQLQKQVQEIRNQENAGTEPKLRYGSEPNAQTGAVRYHPRSSVGTAPAIPATQPLPMPMEPNNPESNPLLALLPTGNAKPGIEESLPPLASAPQPDYATPNPGYHRLANQNTPAAIQPTAIQAEMPTDATKAERRASLFRRIDEEIKRSPTATEQYTVQANDTYLTISDQFYGTSRLFRALAEYNRQKHGTDYRLAEGTVIEVPTADYLKTNFAEAFLRGRSRRENGSSATNSSSAPTIINYSIPPVQGIRYTVQEYDTVFRIATNQLRDSSRWQEIIQMNPAQLHGPRDILQPGMEIILPATTVAQTRLR